MNIKKHKNKIINDKYSEVSEQINNLHKCRCPGSFKVIILFFSFFLSLYYSNILKAVIKIDAYEMG